MAKVVIEKMGAFTPNCREPEADTGYYQNEEEIQ
jgi:hypothetical protein